MKGSREISGNIVDVVGMEIYPGTLRIKNGRIDEIRRDEVGYRGYIIPGFIDAHIHIESSMLPPSEFSRIACAHGTVAAVADPHEIANVLGVEGVEYMIRDAEKTPVRFFFGAPSCVPASGFESGGARIGADEIERLFREYSGMHLSEVMDYPGVLREDPEVMAKIGLAKKYTRLIDGHAPGLRGDELEGYVSNGISTDHESTSLDEAAEKIGYGMSALIREGSSARNFKDLMPLIGEFFQSCMFCSDDRHPDDLCREHIDGMVRRCLSEGIDEMKVFRAACMNPVIHYRLDVGLLREGDRADLLRIDNFRDLNILETVIDGTTVAVDGRPTLSKRRPEIVNRFDSQKVAMEDLQVPCKGKRMNVIGVVDGQIGTKNLVLEPSIDCGFCAADPGRDILKAALVSRYGPRPPVVAYASGFGLRSGAIAQSVSHDSHNVIGVGASDQDLCRALNLVIEAGGALSLVCAEKEMVLPLPIAGLMSDLPYDDVASRYSELDRTAKDLGSKLRSPYMTLSFLSLSVIPEIRLTDQGLLDSKRFMSVGLFRD